MWKAIAPVLVAADGAGRIVGLAGLPDDLSSWQRYLNMLPDEIFGAAVALTVVFAWQRWGGRVKAAVRKAMGRAKEMLSIGSTDYIPFDNLVDVVAEIDMKPSSTKGVRIGRLPEGTNLVCFPNGRVRLALPRCISGIGFTGVGSGEMKVTLKKEKRDA